MLGAEGLVDALVAEHVWEHLSLQDAHRATRNCERHLRPGGRLRIAVPDPAWYSASAGSSSTLRRDEGQAFARHGDNHTASRTQTERSTTSDAEKTGGGGNGRGHGGGIGARFGGESEDSSEEEEEYHNHVTLGHDEVSMADRTTTPAGLDLPGWLSQEMLLADARDRHLVQFTPELLANVCWSAGLIPFLLEGGGASGEVVVSGEKAAAGPATKAAGTAAEMKNDGGNDKERREASGLRRQKAPLSLAWFPTASDNDAEESQQHHRWGHIRRSAAGGDLRGAVSIVMDCVKPTAVGKNNVQDHLESLEAGHFADNQPARHDAEGHQSTFHRSQGLAPSEASSASPYSVPPQQRPSVSGDSLTHAEQSRNLIEAGKTEVNGRVFAGAVAGITSGVGHGYATDGSVAGGVVALGMGAATDTAAAADRLDGGHGGSASIVVRPVVSRPRETNNSNGKYIDNNHNNNRASGQRHAFGRSVMAANSCRGLLCDGGGQIDDAAGSGEGG